MTKINFKYQRIVIKVGSNVLTEPSGALDKLRIASLAKQIALLDSDGAKIMLVTSGAVAAGRGLIKPAAKLDAVRSRQLLAAVGQVSLLQTWSEALNQWGLTAAQVLLTREDFKDQGHYQNIKNCLEVMLTSNVIPVINENDVVAVTELMFTDNDELAGLLAGMVNADALVLLTNVDGVYQDQSRSIVPVMNDQEVSVKIETTERSSFGRGGMQTKLRFATRAARMGVHVHIANGRTENVLTTLMAGDLEHTRFLPAGKMSTVKKRIGLTTGEKFASIRVDAGARQAITGLKATSLLPVGIQSIDGSFQKGDIIAITDQAGQIFGYGKAEYGAEQARGKTGKPRERALIHYDYLYITE